jgi:hypothetical protein
MLIVSLLACAAVRPACAEIIAIRSAAGHFIVRVTGLERSQPLHRLHGFELRLETTDGRAAAGASIVLSGRRLDASNPLPTLPRVAPATGEGNYRVEGVRFHMPGDWHLVFDIDFEQVRDRAVLDIMAK